MSTNTKISVSELSKHDKVDDLWVAINGKVYDFTSFAPEHPGTFLFYFAFELRRSTT
jgi:cytochrome b involved in lipid metabolism